MVLFKILEESIQSIIFCIHDGLFLMRDIWIRSRAQEQHNCVREKTGLANSSPALSGRGAREYLTILDNTWLYLTILSGRGARVTLFPGLTLFLEPFAPQPAALLSPLFLVTSCPLLLSFILPALWLLAFVFFSSLCLLRVVLDMWTHDREKGRAI